MYQSLFDIPKMETALVLKPTFEFIHAIYVETLKQTAFGELLFTEEQLDIKYYDNIDKQFMFLNKLVEFTRTHNDV